MRKMDDITSAARVGLVVVGVGLRRRPEEFTPFLAPLESEGVLYSMAGFVAEQPETFGVSAAFDLENLSALESL